MATRNTPQGPCDREAERAILAAGLWHPSWHYHVRCAVAHDDYRYVEHRAISRALDDLYDVGHFWPLTLPDYTDPDLRWPSSLTTRCAAVATMTDLNVVSVRALADYADGRHTQQALVVADLASIRDHIFALRTQLADLT